jgi:hypothetical protein
MKVMFWNLLNLGDTKLTKTFPPGILPPAGMGGSILDFIVKVNTGNVVWQNATSQVPVDVFIIVELKSGGSQKGNAGTGACLLALARLKAAMNAVAPALTHKYKFVAPLIIGYHEVVGILYNKRVLTPGLSGSMRNSAANFLRPRTAFWSQFTVIATGLPLNIIGIHGPTSKPTTGDYKNAVVFTNDLNDVAQINQGALNPKQATLIGGDFNVDPLNGYSVGNGNKKKKIGAFDDLVGSNYKITLANGTLTSLRNAMDNTKAPPANYLSQPYDNIVFRLPGVNPAPQVNRVNVIGQAPTFAGNPLATFNAARKISDHLPIDVEW